MLRLCDLAWVVEMVLFIMATIGWTHGHSPSEVHIEAVLILLEVKRGHLCLVDHIIPFDLASYLESILTIQGVGVPGTFIVSMSRGSISGALFVTDQFGIDPCT